MKSKKLTENRTTSPSVTPETLPPGDTSRVPVDPATCKPLALSAQPGYYPGYSTLQQRDFWDEATRQVVLQRIEHVPLIRFFTPDEALFMQAVCDRLLPQDDRDEEHTVPLVNVIDDRLFNNRSDGYRYEDMPPDGEAYRLGIQAIDAIAKHMFAAPFLQLGPREQDSVLQTLHDAQPPAADEIWQKMSVQRFWMLLMQDVVEAYYAHPYAWDEIGYGGQAYPRGYMRLEGGKPEPWEVPEQRYDWEAPITSLSDRYIPLGGPGEHKQQAPGQAGTH